MRGIIDPNSFSSGTIKSPRRIISLVPSLTETICDLNGEQKLVGVTRFCEKPTGIRKKKVVIGGTKNPAIDKIKTLNPDLIIANKEENVKQHVEELADQFPVYLSNVKNIEDTTQLIRQTGQILKNENEAERLNNIILEKINYLQKGNTTGVPIKKVLYLIWRKPFMTIGYDTFIHHMLELSGFKNVLSNLTRYPIVDHTEIDSLAPDLIFLSSEPYPFQEKHIKELSDEITSSAKFVLVNGMAFSWYGSGLSRNLDYLINLRKKLGML